MNSQEIKRVSFYLGSFLSSSEKVVILAEHAKGLEQTVEDLSVHGAGNISCLYNTPLKDLLVRLGYSDRLFCFFPGDVGHDCGPVTMCKNRTTYQESSIILRCLNTKRHWELVYDRPEDIPFLQKTPTVFWRGTTTGNPQHRWNRFDFVRKWHGACPDVDVGFSHVCQRNMENMEQYQRFVIGRCDPETFLQHRYVLSIPGNDKDSGLNWKLNSNSVVFMARPRVTSWLMESELIPDYHYVLLKDDYSNLAEKRDWCEAHPKECQAIVEHANAFMAQFLDQDRERRIEEEVIHEYFKRTAGNRLAT